ncbi:hypothetical protein [Magnetofaba australis]|uniref:Uncharacterized protein n=1 Tax=Magnetofaba australis IT-1 TaxID=1434232 RepID=A0A1Y2K3R3_9PROT|nr:hypothetical protein [Magnetofaba australis]OSM04027.1 hypothetical protein MAIT1_03717 [Magnetofaba australis IT-1]
MSGIGVIPIVPAAQPKAEPDPAAKPEYSLHVGFRNGRFVAYQRKLIQEAPATDYHKFTSSQSGALHFTYEPAQAREWTATCVVDAETLKKLDWIGKTPEEVGLQSAFWVLRVDDEGHFEEVGGGHPWAGESEIAAMAAWARFELDGVTGPAQESDEASLERYRERCFKEYLSDLMPGEEPLEFDQFETGLSTREADPCDLPEK